MLHRVLMFIAGGLLVAAVGVGVAAAQGTYGEAGDQQGSGIAQPTPAPAPGSSGEMTASRLSWSAYPTGQQVIDGEGEDAGDPDAKGSAMFLQVDQQTVCYGFALRGADAPTVVQIHKGQVGQNGQPVVTFTNPPKDAAGAPAGDPGASSGCKTSEDPAEIAALRRIRRNPGNYYVSFATGEFPQGAVRGQLSRLWYANGDTQ